MIDNTENGIPCFQVAKTIVDLSAGEKVQLQIQKIMYFCHMIYMGENNKRLVLEPFETWRFGPAVPKLYQYLKHRKNRCITKKQFVGIIPMMDEEGNAIEGYENQVKTIKYGFKRFNKYSPYELVKIAHWSGGAWKGACDRGPKIITDDLILQEYEGRLEK